MIKNISEIINPVVLLAISGTVCFNLGLYYLDVPIAFLTITDMFYDLIIFGPLLITLALLFFGSPQNALTKWDLEKKVSKIINSLSPKLKNTLEIFAIIFLIIGSIISYYHLFFRNKDPNVIVLARYLAFFTTINFLFFIFLKTFRTTAVFLFSMIFFFGFGLSMRGLSGTEQVLLQFKDNTSLQGKLYSSLERGCLIKMSNNEYKFILWPQIKDITTITPQKKLPKSPEAPKQKPLTKNG